ncbi:uncharacterized protein ACBT44_015875 isoform 1-T1 [Syngnathus typhle]
MYNRSDLKALETELLWRQALTTDHRLYLAPDEHQEFLLRCTCGRSGKMTAIFPITLLIGLMFASVCGLDVNVTRDSYWARENDNITLGWKFTSHPNMSLTLLRIRCEFFREGEVTVLFQLQDGVVVHLVGRVRCDWDALGRGQISLQLSSLRMEDSGVYRCQVNTSNHVDSGKYHVMVTASPVDGTQARPSTGKALILKGLLLIGAAAAAAAAAIAAGYLFSLMQL